MKTTVLLAIATLLLVSCGDATDTFKCHEAVIKKAGESSQAKQMPGARFTWVVKKPDGSIWIFKTGALSTSEVTDEMQVFP